MPTYSPPSSDRDRAALLNKALQQGREDASAGKVYLDAELLDQAETFVPAFEAAINRVDTMVGNRSKEQRERSEAAEKVGVYVRDFWECARRRTARLGHPNEVLKYWGLTLEGRGTYPSNPDGWLPLARQVLEGDGQAVQAGYPAMANPSAAEIQDVLEAADKEAGDVPPAESAYQDALSALQGQRTTADDLVFDVYHQLRYTLRRFEPPSQRRLMRTYGIKFAYSEGETPDPDDVAADTTLEASAPASGTAEPA